MAVSTNADYESLPFLNVFTPEYAKDPLGTIAALGARHAMARSPRGLECLSYDLSWELLRDERFPVGFEELLTMCGLPTDGAAYHYFARNTAALEGEEHRRQRRLLAPLFSPAAIERARQVARVIVTELLNGIKSNEFDFAVDVAPHVPSAFFCYLIGAPMSDRALVAACSDSMIKAFRADPAFRDEIEHGTNTLVDYVRQHIKRKRTNLGDDALSQLIEAEQRGETTTDEIVEILFTMLAASTDNTNASLSHAVMAFAENPEQWDFLRKNLPWFLTLCRNARACVRTTGPTRGLRATKPNSRACRCRKAPGCSRQSSPPTTIPRFSTRRTSSASSVTGRARSSISAPGVTCVSDGRSRSSSSRKRFGSWSSDFR